MKALSQLVNPPHIPSESYVRTWAKENWNLLVNNDFEVTWSPERKIFTSTILLLSYFGTSTYKTPQNTSPIDDLFSIRTHTGDAILFEIGCYVYSRVDLWLFQNKPVKRKAIALSLADDVIDIFNHAFNSNISQIFTNRIEGYGWLVRRGVDIEQSFQLQQLMMAAINNRLPEEYHFETPSIVHGSAFTSFALQTEFARWMPRYLPVLIDFIKMAL